MANFIKDVSEFFDLIVRFITSFLESIASFAIAITNIFTGLTETIGFFPSFLGGIMLASLTLIVLLRIIGR